MLPWRAAPSDTPASAGNGAASAPAVAALTPIQHMLELRAMAWLARREYTRIELGRRLLRLLRDTHRKAGLALRAASSSDWQAAQAAALADEFAPAPPSASPPLPAADPEDDAPPAGFDQAAAQADINRLLDHLEAQGVLSDARAAEMLVDARKSRRGLMRIQQELAQRGVSPEQAQEALAGLREAQVPLAREVWRKRFGTPPQDTAERQKQTRFLASRGFSFDVIRQVLDLDDVEPE